MSRPRRNSEKTVRLTLYVDPSTLQHLADLAAARSLTIGAYIDTLYKPKKSA
jgi:hypothetical protein